MTNRITIIGGSKGGVGKSIVAMAAVDFLLTAGCKVLLIESDTSNPDVYKAYKDDVDSRLLDLDERDGWIELLNVCDADKDSHVVVNSAARSSDGVRDHGRMLNQTLQQLQRELFTLWVINRQRDSLDLLRTYQETISNSAIHVVRNGYFGDESKFQLYNDSRTRQTIEQNGGKSVTFPDLADRVADDIYSKRLTIARAAAAKELPFGNRAELQRWRCLAHEVMQEVMDA